MKIHVFPLKIYEDARGWLVENESITARKSMKHFLVSTTKAGAVRGGHYHKRKREWFLVIHGKGRILFRDIKTGEDFFVAVDGKNPKMVEIPPLIAHAIVNTGKQDMTVLGIVNEPLDRIDPDTYLFPVL